VQLEILGKLGKKNKDLIGTGTRDLSACSIVPQPTTLPRALHYNAYRDPEDEGSMLLRNVSECLQVYSS
jgi:hypothetical protein